MAIRWLLRRNSIGAKIFGAFIAMSMITGALGGYGLYVLFTTGRIVADTYDKPLMAINFARAASLTFARMDKERLQRGLAPDSARMAIDRTIDRLSTSFLEDLAIAEERALAASERKIIAEIKTLFAQWTELRRQVPIAANALDTIDEHIVDRFDVLIELIAGHTFIERRKAISSIAGFQYISVVALAIALLVSGTIAFLMAQQIARPLSAAAAVANRISTGAFDTPIPAGGKDETGTLLRSMTIMQANIRGMMAREQAQRRSAQNRLADAIESSREGMMLVDAAGKIVIANNQIATFFPAVGPRLVSDADFAEIESQIRQQLTVLDETDDGDASARPIDDMSLAGEYQLTDGRWLRFTRSNTQEGGFFLFLSDFTDIKEREERFKKAKLQAEEASHAKTNFLANMSHELRTPLNAIIGFSEIIETQLLGAVGNPKYVSYAGDIVQSGRHLLDIINSVLDLAKSDAGKLQLSPEPISLKGVIEDCATMMREQCARAELTFDIEHPDESLVVFGERAKLRQIILNLLSNAVKFTKPAGRVRLLARALSDERAEIHIVDTGIGMSAQEIPIALAPFGQVDSALTRRYEGTGLGLPLTKALIDLHGGTLTIDSEPGRGTTVIVSLPQITGHRTGAPRVTSAA